jgi:uncharacterized protein (DUF488 family)
VSGSRIMTIGHSTRTAEEFLALLDAHRVTGLADVRTIPRSRRHPHFSRESLIVVSRDHGIAYHHFAALGGLRTARPDSRNGGWRHAGFRGYADHMESAEFREALDRLLAFAQKFFTAVMCAESKWWQCHRRLIADALLARGIEVRHIMSSDAAPSHELTPFAQVVGTDVSYPGLV